VPCAYKLKFLRRNGARDRNRTSDTRIFNPKPNGQNQGLKSANVSNCDERFNRLESDCQTGVEISKPLSPPKLNPATVAAMAGQNSNTITAKSNHGRKILYLQKRLDAIANLYDPEQNQHDLIDAISELAEQLFVNCDDEDGFDIEADEDFEFDRRGLPSAFTDGMYGLGKYSNDIFPKNPRCRAKNQSGYGVWGLIP
jgi:hypothetical protein